MSIAAIAVAETPVAAQIQQQTNTAKTPLKRQIVAKSDPIATPEAR